MSQTEVEECDHGFEDELAIDIEDWKTFETPEYFVLQLYCMCWNCGKKYVHETKKHKQTTKEKEGIS